MIRSSGTFRVTARRLRAFLEMLRARFGGDLGAASDALADDLRATLLAVPGIGPEIPDAISLYAAGEPAFVIDA